MRLGRNCSPRSNRGSARGRGRAPWPADFDCDWDVDFYDFIPLCDCLTVPDAGLLQPVCECADFDRDVDVDLVDVLAFQAAFTGS